MEYPTSPRVTPREYEAWELLAHGASYQDVARLLRGPTGAPLSQDTVKNLVMSLLRRVGVTSTNELIVVWYGGELLRQPQTEIQPTRRQDRPTPLKERTTLFPTRAARRASLPSDEERQARREAHPWRHAQLRPRGDVLPTRT